MFYRNFIELNPLNWLALKYKIEILNNKHRADMRETPLILSVKFEGAFFDKCGPISSGENAAYMMVRGALCAVLKGVILFTR